MNAQTEMDSVEDRLKFFAGSRDVPANVRDQAQRYLSRLVSPVRVTLFGRPSDGKSALLPVATNGPILPPLDHPPTIELRYSEEPSLLITMADGTVAEPQDASDPDIFTDAILAAVERPDPLLRRLSFLDVQAEAAPGDQMAAIAWAAPRTDIAILCSEKFDAVDQDIWDHVPDQVRDHAYLVLTGCSEAERDAVDDEFADEFHAICSFDPHAERSVSGIEDLIERLLHHARLGRQADADGALLFLRAQDVAIQAASNRPASRPALTAEEAVNQTAEAERPVTQTLQLKEAPSAEGLEIYSAALTYIRKRSASLLQTVRSDPEDEGGGVARHCGETLVHLSDLLARHEHAGPEDISELSDAVLEAESLVILLENERGKEPALDALAILLQIRRDFESRLAA